MGKRVEIIIGEYPNSVSLDLTEDSVSIALQYNIDDVRNIEKKNTNHSKTITLAGTKTNNKAFGNLFDVNADFTKYNPNKKVNARIVVDSSPVLEGYIQLQNINKDNLNSLQGSKISYNVAIFDTSVDFFQSLGDKELSDLDLSSLDHVYGQTEIENAWNNHTYTDLYQYPLLDKDTQGYETTDFKPCFYHKGLLLKVANDIGYNLEGSFINTNTQYDKELIGWDGETPTLKDSQIISRKFKSSLQYSTYVVGQYTKSNFNALGTNISSELNYNDITTTGLFDNTSNYNSNSTLSFWEVTKTGRYDFSFNNRFNVIVQNLDASNSALCKNNINGVVSNNSFKMLVLIELIDSVSGNVVSSQTSDLGFFSSLNAGDTEITDVDKTLLFSNLKVTQGQKIYPRYTLTSNSSFGWENGGNIIDVAISLDVLKTLNSGATSSWFNEPSKAKNIQDGDIIELSLYLPKKIKQKDLFIDLIKRYNLYIKPHPTNNKTLILETRDDFYKGASILDWTQKKDYSSNDNIKFLAELQNKEIVFTYKKDTGSPYAEAYEDSTGDLYGQKKIEFDNDFVKGTKKIESVFSSTPLIFKGLDGNNVVVSNVDSEDGKRVPSLLYWGGLIPCKDANGFNSSFDITWGSTTLTTVNSSDYPYAGHYDNPYSPTIDIHFGEITYEYYGILLNSITNNNLFNKYWRNYINQISDGKIITSFFYLKETDINYIKDNLNAKIFVKDSYYVINKIVDYMPLKDGLTKVELLQIQEGVDLNVTNSTLSTNLTQADQNNAVKNKKIKPLKNRFKNNVNSKKALVVGQNNYVGSGSTGIVNGNNNNIGGNNNNLNVQGNGNTIQAGLDNVVVVGDGQTVTESNTTLINGVTIQNGVLSSDVGKKEVTLEIGSWNMTGSTTTITVLHNLSTTEWLTVSNLEVNILDDNSSALFRFADYQTNRVFTTPSVFVIELTTGSTQFNTTDFDDSSINRGFIYFSYTQD